MQLSNIPTKFTIPFANSAGGSYIRPIPTPSQLPGDPGAASFTDGFPPDTFVDLAAGGIPPNGEDWNGILNMISAWQRWQAAGGAVPYDGSFQSSVGGYPAGAVIESATTVGLSYVSLVDNNTTNPDNASTSAGWRICLTPRTGEVVEWSTQSPPAWLVPANGQTLSRAGLYSGLFSITGGGSAPYGPGDGSTTFVMPDWNLHSTFLRGWNASSDHNPSATFGVTYDYSVESHSHTLGVHSQDASGGVAADGTGTQSATPSTSTYGGSETRPISAGILLCVHI